MRNPSSGTGSSPARNLIPGMRSVYSSWAGSIRPRRRSRRAPEVADGPERSGRRGLEGAPSLRDARRAVHRTVGSGLEDAGLAVHGDGRVRGGPARPPWRSASDAGRPLRRNEAVPVPLLGDEAGRREGGSDRTDTCVRSAAAMSRIRRRVWRAWSASMSKTGAQSGLRTNRAGWFVMSDTAMNVVCPDEIMKALWPGVWPCAATAVIPETSSLPASYLFTSLAIGAKTLRALQKTRPHGLGKFLGPSQRSSIQ